MPREFCCSFWYVDRSMSEREPKSSSCITYEYEEARDLRKLEVCGSPTDEENGRGKELYLKRDKKRKGECKETRQELSSDIACESMSQFTWTCEVTCHFYERLSAGTPLSPQTLWPSPSSIPPTSQPKTPPTTFSSAYEYIKTCRLQLRR